MSTHGYVGNQIIVWNFSTSERICVLEGHSSRVLHLALSPDSQVIATASHDETLKFWKVFPRTDQTHEDSDNWVGNPSEAVTQQRLVLR